MAMKKPRAPKKIKIPIAMTEDVYEALKKYAESQNRSMSGQVIWTLRKELGLIEEESKED